MASPRPRQSPPRPVHSPDVEDRRNKVVQEINLPTFAWLFPAMAEICRYISFEDLGGSWTLRKGYLQFLKPEFLNSFFKLRD